eukprot:COSAG06_NODE_37296_length_437_cov_0.508876_1_plen_143_part_01
MCCLAQVIATIVALLIPRPRVFLPVIFCIVLSVLDTVGFMYYWDVTISSISTIYILICVGLAVDYAAHIAHFFKDATGTSTERVAVALSRIGPSVFNVSCTPPFLKLLRGPRLKAHGSIFDVLKIKLYFDNMCDVLGIRRSSL